MGSKGYFENVATEWDSMRESFFPESIREKAFGMIEISDNDVIADIGCGTGYITEGLVDKPVKIIAVDQSENMLNVMKNKFQDNSNISYKLGTANELPIPSESVDFAFANMYLHHVDIPSEAIGEAFRILKKNGKFIITDLDKHNHSFLLTEHHDKWMGFDRKKLESWYIDAGFKNVSIECAGESCKSNSTKDDAEADISVIIAIGSK
jgi:ubiquinone/menaquinone biosynthesis C-methylase UbiE